MDVVDRIFDILEQRSIEQKEFASAVGVAPSKVTQWKNRSSMSYLKRISIIANYLSVSVEYLINGEKKEPTPVSESEPVDSLEAQLMNLVRQLTPDSKKMLIAQLKVLLSAQEP